MTMMLLLNIYRACRLSPHGAASSNLLAFTDELDRDTMYGSSGISEQQMNPITLLRPPSYIYCIDSVMAAPI